VSLVQDLGYITTGLSGMPAAWELEDADGSKSLHDNRWTGNRSCSQLQQPD
jgi:hypothetical protein